MSPTLVAMKWNWQQINWPKFSYNPATLATVERAFELEAATLIGASSIITEAEKKQFTIELMSEEALKSSGIEGEMLNRDSVTSSLLCQLGLAPKYSDHRANDKEKGIAALMVDNYHSFDQALNHNMMFQWQRYVVTGSWRVRDVGQYRTSNEPMQVVSGYEGNYKVHFEAPPAAQLHKEMDVFIQWYNDSAPNGCSPLPALTRAAIAHLYFVSIHPFEDGNGRIARALSEKALAQALGRPALVALSHVIEKSRRAYYTLLETHQKELNIDAWLSYFANIIMDGVKHSQQLVHFVVQKTRLLDSVRNKINQRQEKALLRMLAEGMEGFKGGLSAKKYTKITGAISRTASRDLQKLVEIGALTKTGQLKSTRYWLNLGKEFDHEKIKSSIVDLHEA